MDPRSELKSLLYVLLMSFLLWSALFGIVVCNGVNVYSAICLLLSMLANRMFILSQ
jgi:hypothetical protein